MRRFLSLFLVLCVASGVVLGGGTYDALLGKYRSDAAGSIITGQEAGIRTALALVPGTNVQAYDADLTTWAGVTPSANVLSLVGAADYAAMRGLLDLEAGTDVQAYDADLTTWAGITPSANVLSLVGAADYAAMQLLTGWLTAEADTLATVTGRGATSAQSLTLTGATPLTLGEDVAGGTPNVAGSLKLWGSGDTAFSTVIQGGANLADVTLTLPTTTGTLARIEDVHTQNTDTGTTADTWRIDSDGTDVRLDPNSYNNSTGVKVVLSDDSTGQIEAWRLTVGAAVRNLEVQTQAYGEISFTQGGAGDLAWLGYDAFGSGKSGLVLGSQDNSIGNNGQCVLSFAGGGYIGNGYPTTSPADTVQLVGIDFDGTAGARGLAIRSEDGYKVSLGQGILLETSAGTDLFRVNTTGDTTVGGRLAHAPSATTASPTTYSDDGTIAVAYTVVRVAGNAAAVTLDVDPAVADGAADGQIVYIQGCSDANTVTIADACNTQLAGGASAVLGEGDILTLLWDAGGSVWREVSRSDN